MSHVNHVLPFASLEPPGSEDRSLVRMSWTFSLPPGVDVATVEERRYAEGENPYPGYRVPGDPTVVVCLMLIDRSRTAAYLPVESSGMVPAALPAHGMGRGGGRAGA